MEMEALLLENQQLKEKIKHLEFRLSELLQFLYGHKTERFVPASKAPPTEQMQLEFGEIAPVDINADEASTPEEEKITYTRKKQQHPGRHPIPEHLPVEEIVIMPEGSVEGMKQIGKSVVETLDYIRFNCNLKLKNLNLKVQKVNIISFN